MPRDFVRRLERAGGEPAHELDAPTRRIGLGAELDVRRARCEAEPAVHARVERRLVDRHAPVVSEARSRRALFPSVAPA
jgi:hypothetical protein